MRKNSGSAEVKDLNGRVIIRLPRNWFDGKQKSLPLGIPSTRENLAYGEQISNQINTDHLAGQFDRTLTKYKKQPQVSPSELPTITTKELWNKYCDYKQPRWKAKTAVYNREIIGRWIDRLSPDWSDALAVRSYLLASTTDGVVVRVLNSLETAVEWAMRVQVLPESRNPYKGMGSDLKVAKTKKGANALTQVEQEQLIQAFYDHPLWSVYGEFVEFLFLTGCRPSEAIGLHWSQVAADCTTVRFNRSVVMIGRQFHLNELSKTNRERVFYCNDRLIGLLLKLYRNCAGAGAVFRVHGRFINYDTFSRRPWNSLAFEATGRKTTPYSARDTFITHQTEKGKPIAIVAQWVDNSTGMIERKYLDTSATQSIKPD
jgi:integrase